MPWLGSALVLPWGSNRLFCCFCSPFILALNQNKISELMFSLLFYTFSTSWHSPSGTFLLPYSRFHLFAMKIIWLIYCRKKATVERKPICPRFSASIFIKYRLRQLREALLIHTDSDSAARKFDADSGLFIPS